ncbi:CYFIP-related Rac1 interactor homolog [Schistocerca gregaria]|uniref:CYFIP-related Rac1 interactor homolog n=1 Tax=Schistocerca gregaria TaxID=7010 RepID=UPI00211EF6C1|nr:CYFIP-related Rac1 interactor homolog [Schistocerca gregaria]
MGSLISLFNSEDKNNVGFFFDIENAEPTEGKEKIIYEQSSEVLNRGNAILDSIKNYVTCEEAVRKAISSPSPETERAALTAIFPAVALMKDYYNYSQELKTTFISLITALMAEDNQEQAIITQEALVKQLINTFNFVLQWDDAKMLNPGIQNDFSYYRRSLARMNKDYTEEIVVKDELANIMSLFFASPTPMMNNLTTAVTQFLENEAASFNITRESVVNGFSAIANVCHDTVAKHRFQSLDTNLACLRSMTGCIILVDRLHKPGAFYKKSPINIKGCILVLKSYSSKGAAGLINALRWNTIHLQDPETPTAIKNLLA